MGILSCGSFGIGRSMYSLYYFLYVNFVLWHLTCVHEIFYVMFHFRLIELFSYDHSLLDANVMEFIHLNVHP